MKTDRRGLRDWFIITVIILIGFLCLIVAGTMAIRFAPSWQLSSSMDSSLDPNSEYLTRRPQGYVEPLDEAILTPPLWIGLFQTPGATVQPQTSLPTNAVVITSTSAVFLTATIPATSSAIPTNTIYSFPSSPTNTQEPGTRATSTATPTATATATATVTSTATSSIDADLSITKDDGVQMYSAGSTLTYTIIVTNHGPTNITGALVTDIFPASQLENWTWNCTPLNGASGCDSTGTITSDFNDTVDLPNGASIQYTVTAHVLKTASGDLRNTAKVNVPITNTDNNSSNNQASDTDQFLAASTLPVGNIGEARDDITDLVTSGGSTALVFSSPLIVNGHPGYDLAYYEMANGSGIAMDLVVLEIGDGNSWYPIFYWGDNAADTNSTLNFNVLGETAADNPERDNRNFSSPPPGLLYDGTGIAIELDGIVPPGTYPYIRIVSPPSAAYPFGVDLDGGCEVDAIVILN